MRIVALNTYAGSGSTGRIAVEIANSAAKQGWETIIGFGTGAVPPEAEVFAMRIGGKIGRKWHGALRKIMDAEGYGSAAATRKLIRFLKTYQPDVVHLHNIHGCYINHKLLFRYLRRCGVPVVWTLHDCWPFTGHCAYFDFVNCKRWQTQCYACPQKASYPASVFWDGSKRNYRRRRTLFTSLPMLTLVTPCKWLCDVAHTSFLSNAPTRVIYNGVDRGAFYPRASKLRAQHGITRPYVALAVASEWEERKGIRLLPALAQALGDLYQLVVIGLMAEQIGAMPADILALPRTASTRELAQWYSVADCFVNPTLEDNMPLVNLEALACGTPVAVFETGGCPECVNAGCGAVVAKGDVQALALAVQTLCVQKPALQAACVAQAERFDSVATAEAYCALYREVCP